jgi:hypothetical protein
MVYYSMPTLYVSSGTTPKNYIHGAKLSKMKKKRIREHGNWQICESSSLQTCTPDMVGDH